jgi:hypothetical protein
MNLTHLGDVLDHWKGSVLAQMDDKLVGLHVIPMFTDKDRWPADCLGAYAKLLRVELPQVLNELVPSGKDDRMGYFKEITQGNCDLFLDPDTGISPESKCTKKHIEPEEIRDLLRKSPQRILLIYQHRFRSKDPFREKLKQVRRYLPTCYSFAYSAGPVAMVFISKSDLRIDDVYGHLSSLLGSITDKRLVRGRMPRNRGRNR